MATVKELRAKRAKAREAKRSLIQRVRSRTEQIKRLTRRIKAKPDRRGVPVWLPDGHVALWRHPWSAEARNSQGFKDLIWQRGYASPNFTEKETRCKRGDRVPATLRKNAQDECFRLEQVRHELGDRSMPILSFYRPRDYNTLIGGASNSQHIQATAADFDVATVNRFGRDRFDAACEKYFANDGFGQYPSGSRHADIRGYKARWSAY